MKHLQLVLFLLLGVLIAGLTAARQGAGQTTGRASLPAAPRHRPDIVLVTIDAMRADHLSSYGYQQFTSPAIDAFSRHAVRFTNAIAQAPYTKASVASIMTGQYPSAHKTVTASVPFPETMTGHPTTVPISTDVLPSSMTTLAHVLRQAGYRTLGFTANPFLIEPFGFAQGFDRFRFYPGSDFASSDRLVADAIDAARDSNRGQPLSRGPLDGAAQSHAASHSPPGCLVGGPRSRFGRVSYGWLLPGRA